MTQQTISPIAMLFLGACLSTLGSILVTLFVSSKSAAKVEGAVIARLDGVDGKFKEIRAEQDQQWSKINDNSTEIATVKGKLDGIRLAKGNHA